MEKGTIQQLYPTPVYVACPINNLDVIQEEVLQAESEADYYLNAQWGVTHYLTGLDGNIIGESGLDNFTKELSYHVNEFCSTVGFYSKKFLIHSSWFSKFDSGNYAHLHNHGPADISGVYYVKVPENSSNLYFETPNRHLETSVVFNELAERSELQPREGMLVLFPGWLQHGVVPSMSDKTRVSMSFNLSFSRPL